MNREFNPLDLNKVNSTSYMKNFIYKQYVRMANDEEKEQRLLESECPVCYYQTRIGGCAITNWVCGLCKKPDIHGSTATDSICSDCAKREGLCKHCGGTIDMKQRETPLDVIFN